jgi:parallel beta-helix repeat protein
LFGYVAQSYDQLAVATADEGGGTPTDNPVASVFGRIGSVEAQGSDYSAFFYTKPEVDALIASLPSFSLPVDAPGFLANDGSGGLSWADPSVGADRLGDFFYTPLMFGAIGDGVADDTTAVQAALIAAGPVQGVVFLPAGYRFKVTAVITFRASGSSLIGHSEAAIVAGATINRTIDSNGYDRLKIVNVRIEGNGAHQTSPGRGTIHLDAGSEYCTVQRCTIINAQGSGIIDDGDRNEIVDNIIDTTGEHGIYLSGPDGTICSRNRIYRSGGLAGATLVGHAISAAHAIGTIISDNEVYDATGSGIVLRDGCENCKCSGNSVQDGTGRHYQIGTGNWCTMTGNISRNPAASQVGIYINGGGRNVINDNHVYRTTAGAPCIKWDTSSALGGDVCKGNVLVMDGASINTYAIIVDSTVAFDILIQGNVINALNAAAITAAVRIENGIRVRVYDNVVTVGIPELSDNASTQPMTRSGSRATRLKVGDDTRTAATLTSIPGMSFTVRAGVAYKFKFQILWQSNNVANGIKLAVNCGSVTIFSYHVRIPAFAADGAGEMFSGSGTASDDAVTATAVAAANTTYIAEIVGIIIPSAGGTLIPRYGSSNGVNTTTIKDGSIGELEPILV